jgi:hypothetical protein
MSIEEREIAEHNVGNEHTLISGGRWGHAEIGGRSKQRAGDYALHTE